MFKRPILGAGAYVQHVDGEFKGAELELHSRPIDYFDLILNMSWIDAEIKNLGDERYNTNSFDLSTLYDGTQEAPGKPRWFGGLLRYSLK